MLLEVDVTKKLSGFRCSAAFSLKSDRCGIFGPSGSGKSTLVAMLAGLLRPDRGNITLNGRAVFDHAAGISLPPEARRIGVVFQHSHLFPHMSVRKNLLYGMKRLPAGERAIEAQQLISMLQVERLLDRPVANLSGGERQRVALGRAILACPRLILLDEPLAGLDPTLKYQIIPSLKRVFAEFAIPMLFVSHSLQELRMLTEEVLLMHQGRVEQQMATEELARSSLGSGGRGYTNLLDLEFPEERGNLLCYRWGGLELLLIKTGEPAAGRFALDSRNIILFKRHPEAASARNMITCTVRRTYAADWLVGVELDCGGNTLVAEIVPQSLAEMNISPGCQVVAVFKASALRRLY